MSDGSQLNPCNPFNAPPPDLNRDLPPPFCGPQSVPSQKEVPLIQDQCREKKGVGQSALCDPQAMGHIHKDQGGDDPRREVITRYSRALRGADEAVRDMFTDVICIDDDDRIHRVPILIKPPERAVAWMFQENVRKDPTLVVGRVRLPVLSLYRSGISPAPSRYVYHKAIDWYRRLRPDGKPGLAVAEGGKKRAVVLGSSIGIPVDLNYDLTAWAMYDEDMNQIAEQVLGKFSLVGYIRVQGVNVEQVVKLNSVQNASEAEPGDKGQRIIKYTFSLTAEGYIPQPIVRRRAILDVRIDSLLLGLTDGEVQAVIGRLQELAGDEE